MTSITKWSSLSIVCAILFPCVNLMGQNNTSPYSILGIGDIETGTYGRWTGIGSASTALYSNRYLNTKNPASLSQLDDQYFAFEIAGRYKGITYVHPNEATLQSHSGDISMEQVAMAIKLSKKWGSSFGFQPYSTSNYAFYSTKNIEGTNYYTQVYNEGSGSINQFYFSNGFSVNKNFRLGLQASYLFGSLTHEEDLGTDISSSPIHTTKRTYYNNPLLTYGFQYNGRITKKAVLLLGGTFSAQTKLNAEYSLSVTESSTDIVSEEVIATKDYNLPQTATGGIAVKLDKGLTIAADYRHQNWNTLNYKGFNYAMVNSNRYAAGIEYSKNLQAYGQSIERFFYQVGYYYNNSYLKVNDQQLTDQGVSIGAGLNSLRSPLGLSAALQIGTRGTTNSGLIKENYTQFTFTLSYRDFWFTKGRKYD